MANFTTVSFFAFFFRVKRSEAKFFCSEAIILFIFNKEIKKITKKLARETNGSSSTPENVERSVKIRSEAKFFCSEAV